MYVVMPNQLGIDAFDLEDAFNGQQAHMCSADLREFIEKQPSGSAHWMRKACSVREMLSEAMTDADHVYNTPRAWFIAALFKSAYLRYWDGAERRVRTRRSDDLPWCHGAGAES